MTRHAGSFPSGETDVVVAPSSETAGTPSFDADIDKLVSRRLRAARLANGLSQTDFAKRVGLTLQQIHKYETARSRIGPTRLLQFASALGVDIDWLFGGSAANPNRIADVDNKDAMYLVRAFKQIKDMRQRTALLAFLKSLKEVEDSHQDIDDHDKGSHAYFQIEK